jgi:hypothetical protein
MLRGPNRLRDDHPDFPRSFSAITCWAVGCSSRRAREREGLSTAWARSCQPAASRKKDPAHAIYALQNRERVNGNARRTRAGASDDSGRGVEAGKKDL